MKRVLIIPIMIIGILTANCQQTSQEKGKTLNETTDTPKIELIESADLKNLLSQQKDIQLFDVRTPKEFAEGTIGNAVNINFFESDFTTQMQQVAKKDQAIYIFCRSGGRSASAAEKLSKAGFKKIYDLKGGYLGWPEKN